MKVVLSSRQKIVVVAREGDAASEAKRAEETATIEKAQCMTASNALPVTNAGADIEAFAADIVSDLLDDVVASGCVDEIVMDASHGATYTTNHIPDYVTEEMDSQANLSQDRLKSPDVGPSEAWYVAQEIFESLMVQAMNQISVKGRESEKRAEAEAAWRNLEAEMDANTRRNAEEALAREKSADELAERKRQEDAERMALARTAVMMQKLFRGKKARGFARDLRDMRLLQLKRFSEEEKKKASNAVLELQRQVPLPVIDFRRRFDAIVAQAIHQYKTRCCSIVATPDASAEAAIREEIFTQWATASIANEAAIAAALVNSARIEVRKGLVLGRVMRGALERDTLVKGLEQVNSVAQDGLSAALREHLPLAPETVEERMASLKVSIEAKKRLKTYVEMECEKVMHQLEELTRPATVDPPMLLNILACADPGSVLRAWDPLSHFPAGDMNARVLKSRERSGSKGAIRVSARACQQRWRALGANLDNSRQAFTDRVLGTSGGRGWDPVSAKSVCRHASSYGADLAEVLSYLSPPCSAETHSIPSDDTRVLKRRIADLFAPKVAKRRAQRKNTALREDAASALRASSWSDWEPGRFRRKSPEPRRPLISLHSAEANSMIQVDVGVPLSPTELKRRAQLAKEWCSEANQYTVLPEIVHQNFQHSLKKLDNELSLRRGGRAAVERYTSLSNQDGRWDQIRQISRMEHVPVKELFATPRRTQRCDTRDRLFSHLLASIFDLSSLCECFVNVTWRQ